MKKILASLSLAIAASTALAAGPVVGLQYDFDRANGDGFKGTHEAKVSIAQDTKLGTFDAGLLGVRFRGSNTDDDANGYELGYSNGISYRQYGIKGRVAYGRLNQIDPNGGGGFTGNGEYYSLGVEGAVPVTTNVNAFVGYRHRNALNADTPNQNRYTAGFDYAASKDIGIRLGYAHTRQADRVYNGLTAGVSYNF